MHQLPVAIMLLVTLQCLIVVGQPSSPSANKDNLRSNKDVVIIDGTPVPAIFANAINSVKMPQEEKAWVVQVITHGGFNGAGKGEIAITSKGRVRCNPPHAKCSDELTPRALQGLMQMVTLAKPSGWRGSEISGCMDCYSMLLALRRREFDGKERAYFAFWDDTTRNGAPFEAQSIFKRIIALAK
ncbi:MAG: hypothetical protein WBN92_15395 [Terriglobia bacterium]